MKIITVVGARPQFIKAAPVSRELRKSFDEIIVHTGQHYDDNMSKVFFEELGIPTPDYNLQIGSGSHGKMTGEMLIKLEEIYLKEKPDFVLVYGDTNSTLAGALAASKLLIPVIHVEAGLRSFNMTMPEEQNRILTDHISTLLLVPTEEAIRNLKNEGISSRVYNIGDVMYDAVMMFQDLAEDKKNMLDDIGIKEGQYILTTIHRAENTNDINRLREIIEALNECGKNIILPLHPRTEKFIRDYDLVLKDNIKVIKPVGYLEMLMLEKYAEKIVTDSGGVQKEAYFAGKPCITMRDETEWIETVKVGWNAIVGTDKNKILAAIRDFNPKDNRPNIFGNGDASQKIVKLMKDYNTSN